MFRISPQQFYRRLAEISFYGSLKAQSKRIFLAKPDSVKFEEHWQMAILVVNAGEEAQKWEGEFRRYKALYEQQTDRLEASEQARVENLEQLTQYQAANKDLTRINSQHHTRNEILKTALFTCQRLCVGDKEVDQTVDFALKEAALVFNIETVWSCSAADAQHLKAQN